MPLPIEDYALLSDCQSAALVGRDGSIDWLCFPRYDSPSMFAALLGDKGDGRWYLAPLEGGEATRRYDGGSFVLVTRWVTSTGEVEVTDFMPHGNRRADVVRRVRGISGTVRMHESVRIRFGYGTATPWVRQLHDRTGPGIVAVAGPDAVVVRGPRLKASDHSHQADFDVHEGETVDLVLTWYPSYRDVPPPEDVDDLLAETKRWWDDWSGRIEHEGPYRDAVVRSLCVLRALTHEDTGGIAAAATTSLPEQFGGQRNWDYRYVWLRDAALTLSVLLNHGYVSVGEEWWGWLMRAIAGDPADVQIMYGLAGERDLPERTLPNLAGYQGASPVRIGNGAVDQYQADVIGEVMVALHEAREKGVRNAQHSWPSQRALMRFTEQNWRRTDSGIWEMRGRERHFTHSRVMVWAAFDRAVKAVEQFGFDGPVDRWRQLRDEVAAEIEEHGFDRSLNSYVQSYGTKRLDASLLVLPQVGYLKADDPRMLGTVEAIERELLEDGLVMRYRTEGGGDGLPPGESPFLACSFWLVEQYAASGQREKATALMDRLMTLANDVGLLSEEYDVEQRRQAGNTPQALSHLALVRAADAIEAGEAMRTR
ncbi:glycoside hydrolase family 15 protein [Amnibacterium endophyticum]|uniref:Glycoside hydrolase family 15 protein n=1 Tax=Amnibacterium endophyticum TaxID=2109337 RepID=A0ABW4LBJ4_9MICO